MNVLNEVLLQLREADRFAGAEPQLRRLAVVLLDNLVEIQLRRRTARSLLTDRTTWYGGVRQHDRKRRFRISRFHDELLRFAVEQNEITADESILLGYGHRVRNAYYHEGGYDELDSEIAILLFYRFIRVRFPKWKTAMSFHTLSSSYYDQDAKRSVTTAGFESVIFGFESQLTKKDPFGDEFWQKGISYLLTYQGSKSLAGLMSEKAHRLVDKLDHYISTLEAEDGFDWNNVLTRYEIFTSVFLNNLLKGKKLTNLTSVLNIYCVINRHENELLDIDDKTAREKKFFEFLHAHKFNPAILPHAEIAQFRAKANIIAKGPEAVAIEAYLGMEDTLQEIAMAAETCLQDLEIYSDRD
jgi:hypothetical protein